MLVFCPLCGMQLRITTIPADHLPASEDHLANANRFECPACPYQMVLDKRYYERKTMKSKEVEDVLGGADSWKNVDKTESECTLYYETCPRLLVLWQGIQGQRVGQDKTDADFVQSTARTKSATIARRTSDRYKSEVQTSR